MMNNTLDHCWENSPNKAYHLIQAFAPGEVGFEEARRIGKELADKVLEGKYSYVVTTHIDKGHVHNHVIFCAAANLNYDKYHDCKQSYYRIRKLIDTSDEKFQTSPSLKKWASIENLKIAAQTYSESGSLSELPTSENTKASSSSTAAHGVCWSKPAST